MELDANGVAAARRTEMKALVHELKAYDCDYVARGVEKTGRKRMMRT